MSRPVSSIAVMLTLMLATPVWSPVPGEARAMGLELVWELVEQDAEIAISSYDPDAMGPFPFRFAISSVPVLEDPRDRHSLVFEHSLLVFNSRGAIRGTIPFDPYDLTVTADHTHVLVLNDQVMRKSSEFPELDTSSVAVPSIKVPEGAGMFSTPDGTHIVTASIEGSAVWDLSEGRISAKTSRLITRTHYDQSRNAIVTIETDTTGTWALRAYDSRGELLRETSLGPDDTRPAAIHFLKKHPVAIMDTTDPCGAAKVQNWDTGVAARLGITGGSFATDPEENILAGFDHCGTRPRDYISTVYCYDISKLESPTLLWSRRIEGELVRSVLPLNEKGQVLVRLKERIELVTGVDRETVFCDPSRSSMGTLRAVTSELIAEGEFYRPRLSPSKGIRLYRTLPSAKGE